MKALCHREGLLAACQLAGAAVTARDLNPILRNFKMVAEEGRCTLLATDLELSIRLEVRGVQVEEPGEAIFPAARTTAILREATDEEVRVEADPQACLIRGQTMEFEMPSEDPVNFPEVPAFAEEHYHELPAGLLRRLIRRTAFAAAKENARYSMTGVLWELEDAIARLVATDGRRLAVAQGAAVAHGGHATKGQTPVVPSKAIDLLERNLHDEDELVRVSLRPNEALFKTERATICSRLVEGRYPAYRDVFPKKQPVKVPLSVGPFLTAVRQAAIMMDDETKRVMFGFAKGKLTLQAHGKDTGRSKVELPIEFDSKAINISFNPGFLIEMLRALEADASLNLELVDANTVGVFRMGDEYAYLIMPLT
jgi:DNA polymerase-3 subunit beta